MLSLMSVSIFWEFVMLTLSMSRWEVCLSQFGLYILGFVFIMNRSGWSTDNSMSECESSSEV